MAVARRLRDHPDRPGAEANYLRHFGDFRTDYLLFDTFNPPFNDLNVRKAFAHAVDREAIVKNVMTEIKGMPAYSFLMPGFPASDTEGALKEFQSTTATRPSNTWPTPVSPTARASPRRNCGCATKARHVRRLPGGGGLDLDCLNVDIQVSNKDYKVYMDALNAKPTEVTFGAISYGMDYLDPSNMLGIWVWSAATRGRTTSSTP